jgi:hypothetical protein
MPGRRDMHVADGGCSERTSALTRKTLYIVIPGPAPALPVREPGIHALA